MAGKSVYSTQKAAVISIDVAFLSYLVGAKFVILLVFGSQGVTSGDLCVK